MITDPLGGAVLLVVLAVVGFSVLYGTVRAAVRDGILAARARERSADPSSPTSGDDA